MTEHDPMQRWRECKERAGLTWGRVIDGDNFARKCMDYSPPNPDVLEFGYGYCRILKSLQALGFVYRTYCGVDISHYNYLSTGGQYGGNAAFVLDDFTTVKLGRWFDLFISSLTMKHQYPDCQSALTNACAHLRPGGRAVFDVCEGTEAQWEPQNFTRQYTQDEVRALMSAAGFSVVAFDSVVHKLPDKDMPRLLVVGTK